MCVWWGTGPTPIRSFHTVSPRTPLNKGIRKVWEDRLGKPMGVGLGLRDVLAQGLARGLVEAATPGLHERERDGVRRAAVGTSQADV